MDGAHQSYDLFTTFSVPEQIIVPDNSLLFNVSSGCVCLLRSRRLHVLSIFYVQMKYCRVINLIILSEMPILLIKFVNVCLALTCMSHINPCCFFQESFLTISLFY